MPKIDAVAKLFDVVRIRNVSLAACRAHLRATVSPELQVGVRRSAVATRPSEPDKLLATIHFVLEGRPIEDVEKLTEPVLVIEATFNALYGIPEHLDVDDVAMKLFAETNATFNLWPFWREFVQSVSVRMGLPALTVPSYRVEEAFTGPGTSPRANKTTPAKPSRRSAKRT